MVSTSSRPLHFYQKDMIDPNLNLSQLSQEYDAIFFYVHILGISSNEIRDMLNNNE